MVLFYFFSFEYIVVLTQSLKIGSKSNLHIFFLLGNDNIFALTNQKLYSARFDLKDVQQTRRYALYDKFWIDDENSKYTLHISDYSGDASKVVRFKNQAFYSLACFQCKWSCNSFLKYNFICFFSVNNFFLK